ncbi:hypothetical protein GC096_37285 [Paenibacillus sp. LMG 31461]|uniref:Uncharacterized protein n=1 Tax=Paenibacillus plantarum TaxID=2654975 RepID=A0ABX1XMB6_9BACL|nr:hypothetical protein [Paenibacillus plantarum]NOU69678.1 hypothetical protein [Paenibacillus plantarum]
MNAYAQMKQMVEQFCDTLLNYQVQGFLPSWQGGIACPACKCIHGRCGDAIFPMYYTAVESGKQSYMDAARELVQYMKRRQLQDGSWLNDEASDWKGTTVFQVLSLSHAYDYLAKMGEDTEAQSLKDMISKAAEWLIWAFCKGGIPRNNINYMISSAAALQWCAQILNRPDYALEAEKLMQVELHRINRDGFLVGESKFPHHPYDQIDIGYNFDMSIGAMAEYAMLTRDDRVKAEACRTLRGHLQMIYPDGSMDNSFGSRSYKWTLYGSKTAHGCQMALMLLADQDPAFAEAAARNARYLAGCVDQTGLVGYGPQHDHIFTETCIHSTFNRADSLAVALVYGIWGDSAAHKEDQTAIPSDEPFGTKYYPSLNTCHIRTDNLMGTVTGYGSLNAPTGGALSYLWHNALGPIQIGSATRYKRTEMINMPVYPEPYEGTTTPRIEAMAGGLSYCNLYEHDAQIIAHKDSAVANVYGKLKHEQQSAVTDCQVSYAISYHFFDSFMEKRYAIDVQTAIEQLSIVEPIVFPVDAQIESIEGGIQMAAKQYSLEVTAQSDTFPAHCHGTEQLIAAVFPAVRCVPLSWSLYDVAAGMYEMTIRITTRPQRQLEEGE